MEVQVLGGDPEGDLRGEEERHGSQTRSVARPASPTTGRRKSTAGPFEIGHGIAKRC